ncbi:MAG TPA: asparagine--tRNA ligase [Candidatus Aminicenantes bacterium]|nr:asparagine--tRNA ligase [Candidatus Aminicenantes bacterium]
MTQWISIREAAKNTGQRVELRGWIVNLRDSGRIKFMLIRDGSGTIQATIWSKDPDHPMFKAFARLTQESSLKVRGTIQADPRAPGGYELQVDHLEPVHIAPEYPIARKSHGTAFLMKHRHLWLRSQRQTAILRIRAAIIRAIRDFMDSQGFVLTDAPILTGNAAEGTTTLFETKYFGESAYLSQSGQLYAEATAMALGKVYTFGPTFRAEKSKTRRHLIEFWMMEPEWAFAELDDIIQLSQHLLAAVVTRVLEQHREDLKTLERDTAPLEKIVPPFPRITYDEAFALLKASGESQTPYGEDLGGTDETIVSRSFDRPLAITHYPADIKAFYMQPDADDPKKVLCMDVIAPEGYGEIIGGSQRIHDLELLEQKIREHGLSEEVFQWYLDLRRFGSVPHSGFGLGIERTVAWICKLPHIRESIPFPRMLYNLYP